MDLGRTFRIVSLSLHPTSVARWWTVYISGITFGAREGRLSLRKPEIRKTNRNAHRTVRMPTAYHRTSFWLCLPIFKPVAWLPRSPCQRSFFSSRYFFFFVTPFHLLVDTDISLPSRPKSPTSRNTVNAIVTIAKLHNSVCLKFLGNFSVLFYMYKIRVIYILHGIQFFGRFYVLVHLLLVA